MITAGDLQTHVINLPRRVDRRTTIARLLPPELGVTVTSDWPTAFDGRHLTRDTLERAGHALFPWRIASDNPWWNRPLKLGEIGCTLAHWACWNHADQNGSQPYILILEDDAVPAADMLDRLLSALGALTEASFDLVYLGRFPLEADQSEAPGLVVPGYSHCTFGYLLHRRALPLLLASGLNRAIVPVDEFLPAMYIDHPRPDLRVRFPRRLNALAFDPPLVTQRPKHEAGSDTEDSPFADW